MFRAALTADSFGGHLRQYKSQEDNSVNWVKEYGSGLFETRFVQRVPEYFVCYLSTQNACNHGCRFCHLTHTKQTQEVEDATVANLLKQARGVCDYANIHAPEAEVVHFNFMARGEPLAAKAIREYWRDLAGGLVRRAERFNWRARFLISTIIPKSLEGQRLVDIFPDRHPEIYYSLYSMDHTWRRKWMPSAMLPVTALRMLKEWQDATNKIPKIHYAFIAGENDSRRDIDEICRSIKHLKLRVNVNIVRYNPPDGMSRESEDYIIAARKIQFQDLLGQATRVDEVSRVGYDVKASCGMFVNAAGEL